MNATQNEDVLVLVHERNTFYKKKFYAAFWVFILSLITIGFLVAVLIYLIKNPAKPLYFVADEVSRLVQDIPRQLPNMTTDQAAAWAAEAVESAFSYDFVNYRTQLQNAQKYFTEYGWRNYMEGLRTTNNILALQQRKFVIIAKVVNKPKVEIEGVLAGAYAWKFQVPLLVTYLTPPFDEKSKFQNPLMVEVIVQRQSLLNSYKGLGIVQMIANLVYTPSTQVVAQPPPAQ